MASSLLCAAALLSCAADPMRALQRLPYGRLRGGGTVLSQLAAAPQLTAELEAARAQLDATQKAARKARREQRRLGHPEREAAIVEHLAVEWRGVKCIGVEC